MEDPRRKIQRGNKTSVLPDRAKTCTESTRFKDSLHQKNTVAHVTETISAHQSIESELSQSLQLTAEKIQRSESALQQEEKHCQDLEEKLKKLEQINCDNHCRIEQISLQLAAETKNRENFNTKAQKMSEVYISACEGSDIVKASMQRSRTHLDNCLFIHNSMSQKYEEMQHFSEEISTSLPALLTYLTSALSKQEEQNKAYAVQAQGKLDAIREQQVQEKELALLKLSQQKALLNELDSEILATKKAASCTKERIASEIAEKQKLKDTLKKELENLTIEKESSDKELHNVQDDNIEFTRKIKCLQNDLSHAKLRQSNLSEDVIQIQKNIDCSSTNLSEKQVLQTQLKLNLAGERAENEKLKSALEEIKSYQETAESETEKQMISLTQELNSVSSTHFEEENSLMKSLNEINAKESQIQHEMETLKLDAVLIQDELEKESESLFQILEFNRNLENHLSSVEKELEHLRQQMLDKETALGDEESMIRSKEDLLSQMKVQHEEFISGVRQQLASLKQEENLVHVELSSLKSAAYEIHCEIQTLQSQSKLTCDSLQEKNEMVLAELQEKISTVTRDINSFEASAKIKSSELQQSQAQKREALQQIDVDLANTKLCIDRHREEIQSLINDQAKLSNEKRDAHLSVIALSERIASVTQDLTYKTKLHSELQVNVDKQILEQEELDIEVSELSLKCQNTKEKVLVHETENETEKKVFLHELVKFQKTCEYRQDHINVMEKQVSIWNNKILGTHEKILGLKSKLASNEKQANDAEIQAKEIDTEVKQWQAKVASADMEAKLAEKQATRAKKKLDNLHRKIDAHRAAKKKQLEAASDSTSFRHPSTTALSLKIVTPKSTTSKEEERKDNTPKSILKSSKPPTPQSNKRVTFASEDFDDTASSCSTIILVPELTDKIAENPDLIRILGQQQREKYMAAKRMRLSPSLSHRVSQVMTPSPKRLSENEITSSTPENENTRHN